LLVWQVRLDEAKEGHQITKWLVPESVHLTEEVMQDASGCYQSAEHADGHDCCEP